MDNRTKSSGAASTSSSSNTGGGRGFAGMDPEKQREIAAKGGRASHGSTSTNVNSKS